MRVLLWMPTSSIIEGGHRIQFEQTCKHLNLLGVDAVFEDTPTVDLSAWDIVHGYDLTVAQLRACREAGVPIALSPIYGNREYLTGEYLRIPNWPRRLRMALVLARSALSGQHVSKCESVSEYLGNLRLTFELADILLPNSPSEARAIKEELGVTTPLHIVPNAVDQGCFSEIPSNGKRNSILYVARFEPRKNQLAFIEAMRGTDKPVLLVGPKHPHHDAYYDACKRKAVGNIVVMDPVPHEQLPALYHRAKVHALPSWIESPGLVSLEAALCGCNIVTTNRGHTRDFFEDFAWYCDPGTPGSIRTAVEQAYAAPFQSALRSRILDNFTWEHAAIATNEAYKRLLKGKPTPASHARA